MIGIQQIEHEHEALLHIFEFDMMVHENQLPLRLATQIQTGVDAKWAVRHTEALLRYRRPHTRSLWFLAFAKLMGLEAHFDNPSTIYDVAVHESECVLKPYGPFETAESFDSAVSNGVTWSPAEEQRIDKLHCALSVTRAIHNAAVELNPGLTLMQIQRRWMTKQMIAQKREAHDAFVEELMRRERLRAGFIQRTLVFERDIHRRKLTTILARTNVILARADGCTVLERGRPVWHGSYGDALTALDRS